MEEMSTIWNYQEAIDELKQKLLYSTLELESVRAQTNEEMSKNEEYTKQLLQLVKTVCKERDDAKDQLQKLLNKIIIMPPQVQPDSPLLINKPTKANSSIAESNSTFSDTYNYHSHESSPSPELSNFNQPFGPSYNDEGCLVIEKIVEGKSLPEKGKLLKAVLEAGPVLQTLMVAGPLPRWRNPPPPIQHCQIPPFSVNSDTNVVAKILDLSYSPFVEMNCGSSQMMVSTSSAANFGSGDYYGSVYENNYVFSGKRQRFQ